MIISHRHKFIYLRTEKTGSQALKRALRTALEAAGEDPLGEMQTALSRKIPLRIGGLRHHAPRLVGLHSHAAARQVRDFVGAEVFESYFKFAVERNPWDRQVSLYNHRSAKRRQSDLSGFDAAIRSPLYNALHHNRLSNWNIYAIGDTVVADQVLTYDRLQQDLPALLDRIGLPDLEIPRRNTHGAPRPHYSTYYSNQSRDIVGRWYRREIEQFGFEFDDRRPAGQDQTAPSIQTT